MKKTITTAILALALSASVMVAAHAYTINDKYARLVSCEWAWSAVRGEAGYTGTYEVLGEYWTVYFGQSYCEP